MKQCEDDGYDGEEISFLSERGKTHTKRHQIGCLIHTSQE